VVIFMDDKVGRKRHGVSIDCWSIQDITVSSGCKKTLEASNVTAPESNWWRKRRLIPPRRLPSRRPFADALSLLVSVFLSLF